MCYFHPKIASVKLVKHPQKLGNVVEPPPPVRKMSIETWLFYQWTPLNWWSHSFVLLWKQAIVRRWSRQAQVPLGAPYPFWPILSLSQILPIPFFHTSQIYCRGWRKNSFMLKSVKRVQFPSTRLQRWKGCQINALLQFDWS